MTQMNLSVKQKQTHIEKRLVIIKGERVGGQWSGGSGLPDVSYYI